MPPQQSAFDLPEGATSRFKILEKDVDRPTLAPSLHWRSSGLTFIARQLFPGSRFPESGSACAPGRSLGCSRTQFLALAFF